MGVWAIVGGEVEGIIGSVPEVDIEGAQADNMSTDKINQRGMPSLL